MNEEKLNLHNLKSDHFLDPPNSIYRSWNVQNVYHFRDFLLSFTAQIIFSLNLESNHQKYLNFNLKSFNFRWLSRFSLNISVDSKVSFNTWSVFPPPMERCDQLIRFSDTSEIRIDPFVSQSDSTVFFSFSRNDVFYLRQFFAPFGRDVCPKWKVLAKYLKIFFTTSKKILEQTTTLRQYDKLENTGWWPTQCPNPTFLNGEGKVVSEKFVQHELSEEKFRRSIDHFRVLHLVSSPAWIVSALRGTKSPRSSSPENAQITVFHSFEDILICFGFIWKVLSSFGVSERLLRRAGSSVFSFLWN